jgi:hypothetical protein
MKNRGSAVNGDFSLVSSFLLFVAIPITYYL